MEVELEVIVVSYRCGNLLRNCLEALRQHPASCPMRTTVVDSGSGDGTAEMVEEEFEEVRLIRCEHNIGFAAANNLVLRETPAPFVLLLNPDTEVRAGALDICLERLAENPRIGMVGARLELANGQLDHACKRSFPTPLSALGHFSGLGRHSQAAGLAQYRTPGLPDDEPGRVDAINGAFMLVRMAAVREVGELDEGYWLYMEDLDWCYRFWKCGWRVFYEPRAAVLHVKGGSSGSRRGLRQEIAFHRGMGRFYRKFYASERNPALNIAVYAGIGAKLALSLGVTRALSFRPGSTRDGTTPGEPTC